MKQASDAETGVPKFYSTFSWDKLKIGKVSGWTSFEKYIFEDSGSPCVFHLLCFIWIKKMKYLLIQISQYVHMILPKILEFLNLIIVRNLWWKVVLISFILKREIALGKEISDMGMNLHKNLLENNFNVFVFTWRAMEFKQLNWILLEYTCKKKKKKDKFLTNCMSSNGLNEIILCVI